MKVRLLVLAILLAGCVPVPPVSFDMQTVTAEAATAAAIDTAMPAQLTDAYVWHATALPPSRATSAAAVTPTPWPWATPAFADVIPSPAPAGYFPFERGVIGEFELWTFAILGTDDRPWDDELVRTDSIVLVFVVFGDQPHVSLVSLPRDLYVFLPGWGMTRINNVWAYRGEAGFSDMLRYNFGLDLDGFAIANMLAVPTFVDQVLGYVDVELGPALFSCGDVTIDHLSGTHRFTGSELLCLARNRTSGSDYDRILRQQAILVGLRDRSLKVAGEDLFGFLVNSLEVAKGFGVQTSFDKPFLDYFFPLLSAPDFAYLISQPPLRYRLVPPFVSHFDHPETGAWLLALPSAACREELFDRALLAESWVVVTAGPLLPWPECYPGEAQ